jgi:phosphoglycerate dehydrogenase-like enzyme
VEHSAVLEALDSGAIGGFASDVGVGHPSKPSEPWDPKDVVETSKYNLYTTCRRLL